VHAHEVAKATQALVALRLLATLAQQVLAAGLGELVGALQQGRGQGGAA
jgi:hypothetical protein